jgi:hypothetical protein
MIRVRFQAKAGIFLVFTMSMSAQEPPSSLFGNSRVETAEPATGFHHVPRVTTPGALSSFLLAVRGVKLKPG